MTTIDSSTDAAQHTVCNDADVTIQSDDRDQYKSPASFLFKLIEIKEPNRITRHAPFKYATFLRDHGTNATRLDLSALAATDALPPDEREAAIRAVFDAPAHADCPLCGDVGSLRGDDAGTNGHTYGALTCADPTCKVSTMPAGPRLAVTKIIHDKRLQFDALIDYTMSPAIAFEKHYEQLLKQKVEATPDPVLNSKFDVDQHHNPVPSRDNLRRMLKDLGIKIEYDEFADRVRLYGMKGFAHGAELNDAIANELRFTIRERWFTRFSKDDMADLLVAIARKFGTVHPVKEQLNAVMWDGIPRVHNWLHTYMGADDTPYTRAVGERFLWAAVARILRPGIKFDTLTVFEGPQGAGKSQALAILARRAQWFSDSLPINADGQRTLEATQGKWIIEIAEMAGNRKAEIDHIKAHLSRTADRARMAYARFYSEVPRAFVCAATINESDYLRDLTGNRRFWPVTCGELDLKALRRDVVQLWAEAVEQWAVEGGEHTALYLPRYLWTTAASEQTERQAQNPYVDILAEHVAKFEHAKITSAHVFTLAGFINAAPNQTQIALLRAAMEKLGFEKKKIRIGDASLQGFVKGITDQKGVTVEAVRSQSGVSTTGGILPRGGVSGCEDGEDGDTAPPAVNVVTLSDYGKG